MDSYENLQNKTKDIENALGYTFKNPSFLLRAFTHCSYLNEHKDLHLEHNERLEFLGDTVLNLLVAEYLFHDMPMISEGQLSALRAPIVSAPSCAQFLHELGVEKFILVGRGEQLNTGKGKTSIFSDLFEAVLGAIYLDGGLEATRKFFFKNFGITLKRMLEEPQRNFKALLQEYTQKTQKQVPHYEVMEETGPDHEKKFTIGAFLAGTLLAKGIGASKKEAEQNAAKAALEQLGAL